jgi:D-arabinose 1-dehydrogenase-like Zn-dependent alcohol dehydrogenase
VVLVGLGKAEVTFKATDLVSKAVELRGATPVGDPAHLQAVIDMVSAGDLSVKAEIIGFNDIPDGLGRLQRGEVNGRLVAVLE